METITVAKALIVDGEGRCLVLRRSQTHPTTPLQPDLPGGRLNDHEAPIAAICREVAEETGLVVGPGSAHLLFTSADIYDNKNFIRFLFVVHVPEVSPEVSLSWEHADSQWLPVADVADALVHPVYKRGVEYILENDLIEKTNRSTNDTPSSA